MCLTDRNIARDAACLACHAVAIEGLADFREARQDQHIEVTHQQFTVPDV